MSSELKQTNILFHSILEYENLLKIIDNKGFKASYADEKIEELNVKLLMISFSNVALFESRTQINYGDFALGLTREWGQESGLEPVIYTYANSVIGKSFMETMTLAGRKVVRMELLEKNEVNSSITSDFSSVLDNSINMLMYLKSIKVKDKKGNEFIAYNDREWRFVHKHGNVNPMIFETNFLTEKPNPIYEKAKSYDKPYTNEVVLPFELSDLKYIVAQKKEQKKEIFDKLCASFGKEKVLENIVNGDLEILSRDTIWNNL
jgi:hypothetical protein